MSAENGLFNDGIARYGETLNKLLISSEIKYAFEHPIVSPPWSQMETSLLPGTISLSDFFDIQSRGLEKLLSVLPVLCSTYDSDREDIEKSLICDLASLAVNGVITLSEIEELFTCCRLSWSEYWPESRFNHSVSSIFTEPRKIRYLPNEKHISLDNAYYQSENFRRNGMRVVSVMGTFDFHTGHADFLNEARELAGQGLVISLLTSDEEALTTRPGETNILAIDQRLGIVACHQGVDFCVELPWEEQYIDQASLDLHMREVHQKLGAHFRLVGELDERTELFASQCNAAGTRLVYRDKEHLRNFSSTVLRTRELKSTSLRKEL